MSGGYSAVPVPALQSNRSMIGVPPACGVTVTAAVSNPLGQPVVWLFARFLNVQVVAIVAGVSFVQLAEQPSLSRLLPSSHCSFGSRTPSPHDDTSTVQVAEQPSPSSLLP